FLCFERFGCNIYVQFEYSENNDLNSIQTSSYLRPPPPPPRFPPPPPRLSSLRGPRSPPPRPPLSSRSRLSSLLSPPRCSLPPSLPPAMIFGFRSRLLKTSPLHIQ